MTTAAAGLTTATAAGGVIAGWAGEWPSLGGWVVLVLIAMPVVGRVVLVWLALRNTAPSDRPPIISALADLLHPRGSTRRPTR